MPTLDPRDTSTPFKRHLVELLPMLLKRVYSENEREGDIEMRDIAPALESASTAALEDTATTATTATAPSSTAPTIDVTPEGAASSPVVPSMEVDPPTIPIPPIVEETAIKSSLQTIDIPYAKLSVEQLVEAYNTSKIDEKVIPFNVRTNFSGMHIFKISKDDLTHTSKLELPDE